MYPEADNIIAAQLDAGEQLLWAGRPRGGIRFQSQDLFVIPFSILWCGFAVFWEFSAIRGGAPFFFALWGVPFVLVGLYIVFGRFFADARTRKKTSYGVTSERIIIISGLFSRQTKSLSLRTLTDVSLTERGDGSGTITFGPTNTMGVFFPGGSWPGSGRYSPPAFEQIDRAKEVYDIIRMAQKFG